MEKAQFAETYADGLTRTARFLLSRGFPRGEASEAAQAAWCQAWEHLSQLRDETKIVSWVNSIALNYARRSMRNIKWQSVLSPAIEPMTRLDDAAIDLHRILDRCHPMHRENLEAQLNGITPLELAEEQGTSQVATRLRCFRARRAARALCDPPVPIETAPVEIDAARMQDLQQTFRSNRLMFARRHIEAASTFMKLMEMGENEAKVEKLRLMTKKALKNALKSLGSLPSSNGEAALAHSAVNGLYQKLKQCQPRQEMDSETRDERSVA